MTLLDTAPEGPSSLPEGPHAGLNKNLALVVLAIAQLMVVLDATIVNVALPNISSALHVRSSSDLQWVVTGYTLTFGGFLLLGGKLADRIGRRRVFLSGAALFATASLVGGLAGNLGVLLAARAVQGTGGALMSPAALSLITVIFTEGKERNRAFGIYSAITAGGAALGLILGGVLAQYISWRWVFYVNLPIAALAILGAVVVVPESRDEDAQGFDVPGAVLVTGGLMALVYALVKGNDAGWGSGQTIGTLVLAAVLLTGFVLAQLRAKAPLVPFRIFSRRSVLGADLGALLVGAGIFAIFFFLTLWMQVVNGYSPVRSGLAFLPMTVLIGVSAGIGSQLLGRVGPRPLLTVGPILAGLGLLSLGLRLAPDSSYLGVVLPSLALVAFGMGNLVVPNPPLLLSVVLSQHLLDVDSASTSSSPRVSCTARQCPAILTFVALTSAAVAGVPQEDAGIASALLNAGQQIGGALGLAFLTAVSTARTNAIIGSGRPNPSSLVHGWDAGFLVGAAFLIGAGLVMSALVKVSKQEAIAALNQSVPA